MLAIVWAAKHFQSFIYGRHIKFFTDDKPLSTLVKSKEPNGRLYKLLLKLQDLDYSIVLNEANSIDEAVNALDIKLNVDWEYEQDNDRDLALVKMAFRSKDEEVLQDSVDSKFWCLNFSNLRIENGILKLTNKEGSLVIVVPRRLWTQVCSVYHDSISSGHLSFEKTYRSISSSQEVLEDTWAENRKRLAIFISRKNLATGTLSTAIDTTNVAINSEQNNHGPQEPFLVNQVNTNLVKLYINIINKKRNFTARHASLTRTFYNESFQKRK
ncbi:unnamed protein product [Brachionus calyciflorus]|uniref:Reverse transcriptase RNase H-like domain-containing protein n=1 Tax=Brachionus calyciflorus TaxID=104777 RepID=A0A814DWG0_9BILA|nr:unnamed protein product [Brachionus calyciflorus]